MTRPVDEVVLAVPIVLARVGDEEREAGGGDPPGVVGQEAEEWEGS